MGYVWTANEGKGWSWDELIESRVGLIDDYESSLESNRIRS